MPTNVVKTKEDERLWQKAKARAKEQGKAENYAYIMGIYKNMNPKKASASKVAMRFAIRSGPPMQMGSAAMLKRQGLTPVDVWFGEVKPHHRPIIGLNDTVQDRRGGLLYFAGVGSDGKAILGKTEQEAKRLHKKIIEDRKHHTTAGRVAAKYKGNKHG